MKRAVALLMILAFIACGPHWTRPGTTLDHPGHIWVCLDLPDKQLASAHLAVAEWNTVLQKWNEVVPVDHPAENDYCTIIVHERDQPLYAPDGRAKEEVLAWCACVGCREITMRKDHYEQDVSGILQHELGHALGAQHASGSLMDPYWIPGRYVCPDRETVLQVAAWNRIDAAVLSWCQF